MIGMEALNKLFLMVFINTIASIFCTIIIVLTCSYKVRSEKGK